MFLIICFTLLTLSFLHWLHSLITDPLRDIQGPLSTRFTRLWMFWKYFNGNYELVNREMHERYGKIVRIAPNQYSIDDPKAAKIIYGHGTRFTKSDWYAPWGHPDYANLFNLQDPEAHANLRRKLASAYSMSSIVSYEPFVDECTDILLQRLSEFAMSGEVADMRHWFQCFAFDVIGKINFSTRFGFLDNGGDVKGLMNQVDNIIIFASLTGVFGSWYPSFLKIAKFLRVGNGASYIDAFAKEQVVSCQNGIEREGPVDFTRKLLKTPEMREWSEADDIARNATVTNIVAGSDTTSISLSAILYNLCKHPQSLAKLRQELENGVEAGTVSNPITFREAQALPYLQAVVKESLRVHPATGFTMPRVVPVGGVNIMGYHFPRGTTIGINAWVAHVNKDVFGDDAHLFRPERWIDNPERSSQMEGYSFAFGQGSRTCIGKNISLLEISKVIPQIVRQFEFELEDNDHHWECNNHWFVKPKSFRCRLTKKF